MIGRSQILGLILASALIGPAAAQARSPDIRKECNGSSFGTCAVANLSPMRSDPSLRTDLERLHDFTPGRDGDRRPEEARCTSSSDRSDCLAVTVAPEPATMVLLATGLLSIAGIGLWRRKRPALLA